LFVSYQGVPYVINLWEELFLSNSSCFIRNYWHGLMHLKASLKKNDRMAKVALRIAPAYQNQGMATEALKAIIDFCYTHTELQRIWTDVDVRNIGSWKVLEKCGFTRESMIRQGKMVNSWCDYYIYGLLKTD